MDKNLLSVQYLRGLAALAVVIAHGYAHPLLTPGLWAARLGQLGVVVFFVLSGFIMVAISGTGRFSATDFLGRRITRIVPLYWLFTSVIALVAALAPSLLKSTAFTWPHYLLSLLFIPHEAPGGSYSPLLSLGWTLNYEAYFYLCFALLAFMTARGRVAALTILFSAMAVAGSLSPIQVPVIGFFADLYPLAFCAGAVLGLLHAEQRIPALGRPVLAISGLAALAGLVVSFGLAPTPAIDIVAFSGLTVFAVALLAAGLVAENRLPRIALLKDMGDASYATYLLHMFVIGLCVALGTRFFGVEPGVVDPTVLAASIALSLLGGSLVHHLLEKPLIRLFRARPGRRTGLSQPARA